MANDSVPCVFHWLSFFVAVWGSEPLSFEGFFVYVGDAYCENLSCGVFSLPRVARRVAPMVGHAFDGLV